MICFTNHPLHYSASDQPAPDIYLSLAITQKPKIDIVNQEIINDIIHGILQTGNIPNEFPDSDLNIIE